MTTEELTPEQQAMVAMWDAHTSAEFADHSLDKTMATMTSDPFVNHVPVMTGGAGDEEVRSFYATYFLTGHPADLKTELIARTVGQNRVVDEIAFTCTHDIEMQWLLPGVAPTGKKIDSAVIAVVEFEDGRICGERIYWDQAAVLEQVGLLDAGTLPITGAEQMRKRDDVRSEPSNALIDRAER